MTTNELASLRVVSRRDDGPATVERFGRVQVGRRLAVGGMAEIHEAFDERFPGRDLVLKRVRFDLLDDHVQALSEDTTVGTKPQNERLSMLRAEGELGLHLHHPNLLPVLEIIEAGSELGLLMPRVRGLQLDALRKAHGAFSEELAVYILSELLEGLDFAHQVRSGGRLLRVSPDREHPDRFIVNTEIGHREHRDRAS